MTAMIRSAGPDDREAFLAMWDDFVATDPTEPGDRGLGPVNWDRIADPSNPLSCLIAEVEGMQVGFLLHLSFPFTWSLGDICYLEDLYVRPEARGAGHAARMIEALAAIGRERAGTRSSG
jgi:GNAT superfamily N-acetyltransferase